jgi:hypothetical protein
MAGRASGTVAASWLAKAEADARRLEKEKNPWADALAFFTRALAADQAAPGQAPALYLRAAEAFAARGHDHRALAARYRRGLRIGGDEGRPTSRRPSTGPGPHVRNRAGCSTSSPRPTGLKPTFRGRPSVPSRPEPGCYVDIRDGRDGDLPCAAAGPRRFEDLTKAFYSHAAIAAKWHDRLMVLQAEAHVETLALSVAIASYPGRVDWYRLKREVIPGHERIVTGALAEAKADLGLPFGAVDLLKSLWARFTRKFLPNARVAKALFCSEYVHRCFRKVAWTRLVSRTSILRRTLNCKHIEYVATVEHNPKDVGDRTRDDVPPQ